MAITRRRSAQQASPERTEASPEAVPATAPDSTSPTIHDGEKTAIAYAGVDREGNLVLSLRLGNPSEWRAKEQRNGGVVMVSELTQSFDRTARKTISIQGEQFLVGLPYIWQNREATEAEVAAFRKAQETPAPKKADKAAPPASMTLRRIG